MAKNTELHVRLDQHTKVLLYQAAAEDQKTDKPNISKYIRKLIINSNGKAVPQETAIELHQLRNQVIRIGNNLNQMARVANETGVCADSAQIRAEMEKIYQAFSELREVIESRRGL